MKLIVDDYNYIMKYEYSFLHNYTYIFCVVNSIDESNILSKNCENRLINADSND